MLLDQILKIFTEQKYITCKIFNTDSLLQWILTIEEHIRDIEYIPGNKNIVPYALSLLPNNRNQKNTHESTYTMETMSELYVMDEFT